MKCCSSPSRAVGRCLETVPTLVRLCVIVLPEEPEVRGADVRNGHKDITYSAAC